METEKELKASSRMKKGIQKVVKHLEGMYGLEITYEVEPIPSNRTGRGFYDYATVYCKFLHRSYTVYHDGYIYPYFK